MNRLHDAFISLSKCNQDNEIKKAAGLKHMQL